MDTRLLQYYRLCGLKPLPMRSTPLYSNMSPSVVEKIFTGRHVTIMLQQRNGLWYPNETAIGAREKSQKSSSPITIYTDDE